MYVLIECDVKRVFSEEVFREDVCVGRCDTRV